MHPRLSHVGGHVLDSTAWNYLHTVSAILTPAPQPGQPMRDVPIPYVHRLLFHHGHLMHGCTPYEPPGAHLDAVRAVLA